MEVIHLLDRLEIGKVVDTDILEAVVDCESKDRMDVIVRVLDILAMKEEKDFGPYESADQLFEKGEYFHQIRDWMDIIFRHYYQKISTEKSHLSATRINNEIAMFKSELTEHHREATRALIEITVSEHDEDEDEADDDGDDDE